MKICLITDCHSALDDRIYWKYGVSLKKNGYDVVSIGLGKENNRYISNENIEVITIQPARPFNIRILNRIYRIVTRKSNANIIYNYCKHLNADAFHIFNITCINMALRLKKGKNNTKIIYDVLEPHADHIRDYNNTSGILTIFKNLYANYIYHWEKRKSKHFDYIIATEENVYNEFVNITGKDKTGIIYSYTDLNSELRKISFEKKEYDCIYTGSITRQRGAMQILKAAKLVSGDLPSVKFLFLGTIFDQSLKDEMYRFIEENNLNNNIIIKDFVPYYDVESYYIKSKIGLGMFMPIPTHFKICQIKIFEYMAFGLPVVCSNFGHIYNYTLKHKTGIPADPTNESEIADAILTILNNRELYEKFSDNAISAAPNYKWEIMERKLIGIYQLIMQ